MFNRHVKDSLSSYIDTQLTEKQKLKVDTHLKSCKACSEELARLQLLSVTLQEWRAAELTGDFDASVKDKILRWEIQGGNVKMKSKALEFVIPSSALALLLMVAFLGQSYLKRGLEGRIRSATDNMGQKFSAVNVIDNTKKDKEFTAGQYEPYYLAAQRQAANAEMGGWGRIVAAQALGQRVDTKYLGYAEKDEASFQQKGTGVGNLWGTDLIKSSAPGTMGYLSAEMKPAGQAYQPPPGPATLSSIPDVGSVIVIQPVIPATSEGEKVIRTGLISLEVENGQETYKKAAQICQELGGYLAESRFSKDNEGRENGTVTMRIPKDKFLTALDKLSVLGKVTAMNSNSQDVGREYKDLKQELDITMVVYNKMLDALNKKQVTIPEAIRMESELTPVLRRIENLKGKLEYLDNLVSFTTVVLTFTEPRISAKALAESKLLIKQTMIESAINSVKFISTSIPIALFVGMLAVLCIGIVVIVKGWISYLFKRK